MLFESKGLAMANGDTSLPSPRNWPEIQALIHHLDEIFDTGMVEVSALGEALPTIAYYPGWLTVKQHTVDTAQPLPNLRFGSANLTLPDVRASDDALTRIWQVVTRLADLSELQYDSVPGIIAKTTETLEALRRDVRQLRLTAPSARTGNPPHTVGGVRAMYGGRGGRGGRGGGHVCVPCSGPRR